MNLNWYKRSQFDLTDKEFEESTKSKWIPVKSSWITDVAYYEPMGFFEVKLKNGKEYMYKDVPKKVYEDFMKAKSKGEFFNRVIRDKYGNKG
jgi:hypothetical protein